MNSVWRPTVGPAAPAGVDFTNILWAAFTCADPKSAKNTVSSYQCLFSLSGSSSVKAARKTFMKLTPGVNFNNISARLFCPNKMKSFFCLMAHSKLCKILAKFSAVIWRNSVVSELVKLNGKFSAEHCAPEPFCLTQSLMKSTSGFFLKILNPNPKSFNALIPSSFTSSS
jgi:hypothetical protein